MSFRPFRQPEINAPQTTYDFKECLFFGGSIKVIIGFPSRDRGHNTFFSRLTLRVPVSTQKKGVVIESDNVEK